MGNLFFREEGDLQSKGRRELESHHLASIRLTKEPGKNHQGRWCRQVQEKQQYLQSHSSSAQAV